ncbi:MAG: hypothetical protein JJU45_09310 [Acidimicrobiia bacterium]|nr:hypothetical protein [Acidimicrobiia bacterium]
MNVDCTTGETPGAGTRCADGSILGRWLRRTAVLVLVVVAASCSADDAERSDDADESEAGDTAIALTLDAPERCEHFDAGHCLLPFPSDHFTIAADTPTGRQVALDVASMPTNAAGDPVDPTEWNRNDGFSAGSPIVVVVPGLDPAASGMAPITDIGASLEGAAPIVLLDAETGERVPYWAELDADNLADLTPERLQAPEVADEATALLIRPARNLTEGHRHVVALRGLVDGDGSPIEASPGFVTYRDALPSDLDPVEARRPAMERVFDDLDTAGIDRDDLYLAWDFTVRSTEDVTGRLLAMRDLAFEQLGDGAPAFEVASVADGEIDGATVVTGTFEVPLFLTDGGAPASMLANDGVPDGVPEITGTYDARFICVVPAAPGPNPAVLYGHGLLGGAEEALTVGAIAAPLIGATVCGTDWIGMARDDIPAIGTMLGDFSDFRIIPDRLQQAHVNQLFLGRLLVAPDGFVGAPEFADTDGEPVLDGRMAYVGASQGGILGGATTAVATDWDSAALLVPAQNYSTLLDRSIDFDPFALLLAEATPDAVDQQLLLALAQQLWDRGENNGYSAHLTEDPLPGTGPSRILLLAAFGDHQVANVATDVLARTADVPVRSPGLGDGRSPDVEPFWGIDPVPSWPWDGSLYLMWDFGTPAPPVANVPPREGDDPHGMPADEPAALLAVVAFLLDGQLPDPCPTGTPCVTDR